MGGGGEFLARPTYLPHFFIFYFLPFSFFFFLFHIKTNKRFPLPLPFSACVTSIMRTVASVHLVGEQDLSFAYFPVLLWAYVSPPPHPPFP